MHCRDQAAQLRGIKTKAEKIGNMVIIGQGNLAQANDFDRTHGKGLRALVDSERASYKALDLVRSRRATLSPRAAMATLGATRRGFFQGVTQGDAWQMGGTLVVAPGGEATYFQPSEFPGDHPPTKEVLSELKRAAG